MDSLAGLVVLLVGLPLALLLAAAVGFARLARSGSETTGRGDYGWLGSGLLWLALVLDLCLYGIIGVIAQPEGRTHGGGFEAGSWEAWHWKTSFCLLLLNALGGLALLKRPRAALGLAAGYGLAIGFISCVGYTSHTKGASQYMGALATRPAPLDQPAPAASGGRRADAYPAASLDQPPRFPGGEDLLARTIRAATSNWVPVPATRA